MEVTSEKCKSAKTNEIVLLIFLFLIALLFFYASVKPWGIDTKSFSFWVGCIFSLFIVLYLFTPIFSEKTIKEIRVTSNEIQVDYLKNKTISFEYKDISKISSDRVRQQGKAGYISDGYYITTIHLKNKSDIHISQNEFENYRQIIAAIGHNLKNYNS